MRPGIRRKKSFLRVGLTQKSTQMGLLCECGQCLGFRKEKKKARQQMFLCVEKKKALESNLQPDLRHKRSIVRPGLLMADERRLQIPAPA